MDEATERANAALLLDEEIDKRIARALTRIFTGVAHDTPTRLKRVPDNGTPYDQFKAAVSDVTLAVLTSGGLEMRIGEIMTAREELYSPTKSKKGRVK